MKIFGQEYYFDAIGSLWHIVAISLAAAPMLCHMLLGGVVTGTNGPIVAISLAAAPILWHLLLGGVVTGTNGPIVAISLAAAPILWHLLLGGVIMGTNGPIGVSLLCRCSHKESFPPSWSRCCQPSTINPTATRYCLCAFRFWPKTVVFMMPGMTDILPSWTGHQYWPKTHERIHCWVR